MRKDSIFFEEHHEPDLIFYTRKFLPVGGGTRFFETINGPLTTNDVEKWKPFVDMTDEEWRREVRKRDDPDIYDPFNQPPYARGIKPFGSGVGDGIIDDRTYPSTIERQEGFIHDDIPYRPPATTLPPRAGLYDIYPEAPATTLPKSEGFVSDVFPRAPAMTLPESEGFIGFGDICKSMGFGEIQARATGLGTTEADWKACNAKLVYHREEFRKLSMGIPEGMTQADWAKQAKHHQDEYNRLKPECQRLYDEWKGVVRVNGEVYTKPAKPTMEWPTWEFKWTPYTIPAAPVLDKTTIAVNKLGTVPNFFTRTATALAGKINMPAYTPPDLALKFPALKSQTVDAITGISISVTDLTSYFDTVKTWVSSTQLNKLSTAYNSIKSNLSNMGAETRQPDYTLAPTTNIKRGFRQLTDAKNAVVAVKDWFFAAYSIISNSFGSIRDFMDEVIDIFTNLPSKLNSGFSSAVARVKTAIKGVLDELYAKAGVYSEEVKKFVTSYIDYIKGYVGKVMNAMKSWTTSLLKAIKLDVGDMQNWFVARAKDLGNGMKADMNTVKIWFLSTTKGLSTNINTNMKNVGTEISEDGKKMVENFQAYLAYYGKLIDYEFKVFIEKAKVATTDQFNQLTKGFRERVALLETTLTTKYNDMRAKLDTASQEVKDVLENVKTLTQIVDTLKTKVTDYETKFGTFELATEGRLDKLEEFIKTGRAPPTEEKKGFFAWLTG